MARILIVDDDRDTCTFISTLLAGSGRELVSAVDPNEAMARIRRESFDVLLCDIKLGAPETGLDILKAFKAEYPASQAVLMSGFGTLETAVAAMRAGAFDYISKPFDSGDIRRTVERALAQAGGGDAERPAVPAGDRETALLGRSSPMLEVFMQIARAADSSSPVLLVGESGTGKELAARAIHSHSTRAHEPLVAINCGAVVETLLESELFGHARGAFTGAVADHAGLFVQAGGGTVLLDEIGDTTPAVQVRLLRVLEEGEVRPVGSSRGRPVGARVIAATNVDLHQAIAQGRFRQDLYYRLGVLEIAIPPLRERRADLPMLIDHFLEEACAKAGRRKTLTHAAREVLIAYDWPGNVRELRNVMERLVVFGSGTVIQVSDCPQAVNGAPGVPRDALFSELPTLDRLERRYLLHVLDAVGGNRTRAAAVMGIDRRTLYRMAERFGVDLGD